MRAYDWSVHLYYGRIYHGHNRELSTYVKNSPIIACFSSEWESNYFVDRMIAKGFIDSTGKII